MPNIRAIAIRYTGPSAKIGLPLDGTAPDAQAIHGNEAAGDDRHPGFMVESAPILARNGEHAVLCGIESEVDISGARGQPQGQFPGDEVGLWIYPALREWTAQALAAANRSASIQKAPPDQRPGDLAPGLPRRSGFDRGHLSKRGWRHRWLRRRSAQRVPRS